MHDTARRSDLVDIEMLIHRTTERAILASDDGVSANAVWLPLSLIETSRPDRGEAVTVTLPAWLATEKGLV